MKGKSANLAKLERAVLANTHRPSKEELKKIRVHKKILTSLKFEGDSKIGLILFVGVARGAGASKKSIVDYLGLEFDGEYDHKMSEFMRYRDEEDQAVRQRFLNKIQLINNYLNLN